jgi:hypothetical protein
VRFRELIYRGRRVASPGSEPVGYIRVQGTVSGYPYSVQQYIINQLTSYLYSGRYAVFIGLLVPILEASTGS